MRSLKTFSTILLALILSACVYVPVIDENKEADSNCQTFTKHMSMQNLFDMESRDSQDRPNRKPINIGPSCGGISNSDCAAAAAAVLATALVVSAGSAIISGSIVITGNTIHWLEYQGTCSNGYLNIAKQRFLDSVNKPAPTPAI
jgi:hypothetical protein